MDIITATNIFLAVALNEPEKESLVGRATALSLPDITALDEGTMASKPKDRCDI